MSMTVLVAGATGRFGGICGLLLERGHRVRALTREPTSPAGQQLRERGAEVVYGDFDDADTLVAAMAGADGVFATGTLHRAGPDRELRHGRNLAEAARASRLPHLVYVSGAGAGERTGVPVFEVKAEVESRIRDLDVPNTIVAPVYLMDNLFNPWNTAALEAGRLPTYMPAKRSLQQVPVIDVISFAALVLERPERFAGQRLEIASDELTAEEMADIVSRITGHPRLVEEIPPDNLGPGLSALFEWLDRTGHHVDIEGLRREYPEVGWHSFGEWAGGAFTPPAG